MSNPIDDLYNAIQTLEKIKEEISNIRYTVCGIPSERKDLCDIKNEAIGIVDRHLAKLQGEEDDE